MDFIKKSVMVIGDDRCGKSSFLSAFDSYMFLDKYMPSNSENHENMRGEVTVLEEHCAFQLEINVVIVMFSVDSRLSLNNVLHKWMPIVNHFVPNTPVILVGTKKDTRTHHDTVNELCSVQEEHVGAEEGKAMAEQIKALDYLECSGKTGEGVRRVFATVVKAAYSEEIKRGLFMKDLTFKLFVS